MHRLRPADLRRLKDPGGDLQTVGAAAVRDLLDLHVPGRGLAPRLVGLGLLLKHAVEVRPELAAGGPRERAERQKNEEGTDSEERGAHGATIPERSISGD